MQRETTGEDAMRGARSQRLSELAPVQLRRAGVTAWSEEDRRKPARRCMSCEGACTGEAHEITRRR